MNPSVRKEELRHFQTILSAYAGELSAAPRKNDVAHRLAALIGDAGGAIAEIIAAWPEDWPEVIDRNAGPVTRKVA